MKEKQRTQLISFSDVVLEVIRNLDRAYALIFKSR
ncbi:hypothetical protein SOVF_023850 [Spinacia oleracea]|nr:hypothetical protein SOVF_023850 [Spinacia oleracea]